MSFAPWPLKQCMTSIHSPVSLSHVLLILPSGSFTIHTSIQNSLGCIFFIHHFCGLSLFFPLWFPMLACIPGKKKLPQRIVKQLRIHQNSVNLSMVWQASYFSLGFLSYCPQQLIEIFSICSKLSVT